MADNLFWQHIRQCTAQFGLQMNAVKLKTNKRVNGRMNGYMTDRWMGEWMAECMNDGINGAWMHK